MNTGQKRNIILAAHTASEESFHTHAAHNVRKTARLAQSSTVQERCLHGVRLIADKRCLVLLDPCAPITETLTKTEWPIFMALVDHAPYFCPITALLDSILPSSSHDEYHDYIKIESPMRQLHLLRKHLYRIKKKILAFNLSISSVYETGYILHELFPARDQ